MKSDKMKADSVKTDDAGSLKRIRAKRIVSFILVFLSTVIVISEVITFAIWAVPLICLQVWQMSGLGSLANVVVSDLTVTNITVMCMMWLLPCLFLCGMGFYLHCKLLRAFWHKNRKWIHVFKDSGKKRKEKSRS